MNGVHDMGGMHGMGPVLEEMREPVFHQPWESRVFALDIALGGWNKWPLEGERHQIELIAPADYLRMSYYEKWFVAMLELMIKTGLVTREEIATGAPASNLPKAVPPLKTSDVLPMIAAGSPASRNVQVAPRFRVGQSVRTRNIHPASHTRLPRYARAKLGIIQRDYGVFVFPDTNAHSKGENPQHVYSVRFAARELWGQQAAPQDSVYLDLWDDYLEPA